MRWIISVLFVFIVFSNVQGQKKQGIVYFNNGTTLEGLVKLKGFEKLKFKKNKKEKSTILYWKEISKITIYEPGNGKFHFYNLRVKNKKRSVVMQLVYEGEVDLYKEVTSGYDIVGGGSSLPTTVKREYASFYIKKKEEQEVFAISEESGFNKDFKKVAINYFSDCDKVLKKIKENIYTKKNIQDIVFEFNYKCN